MFNRKRESVPKVTMLPVGADDLRILIDVIDLHLQGLYQAKDLTIEDPMLDSADGLLDVLAQMDAEILSLTKTREVFQSVIND